MADLNRARRHDALRAVKRRKRLGKLRHVPADGRLPVHKHDLIARVGNVQRGLNAVMPAPITSALLTISISLLTKTQRPNSFEILALLASPAPVLFRGGGFNYITWQQRRRADIVTAQCTPPHHLIQARRRAIA